MTKRNILGELLEAVAAMKSHREGKLTLRSYKVEPAPLPQGGLEAHSRYSQETSLLPRRFCAQAAHQNERTLEKWEQGRARPNPQAAALVLLVRKYPDTLDRLDRVAAG